MSKGFLKFCISNLIIGQISVSNLKNVYKKASHINYALLHETGKRNKQSSNTIITQAYRSRCSSWKSSSKSRIAWDFSTLLLIKQGEKRRIPDDFDKRRISQPKSQ